MYYLHNLCTCTCISVACYCTGITCITFIYNVFYLFQSLPVSSDGEIIESPTAKDKWEWPTPETDKPINKGSILLKRGRTRREVWFHIISS